MPGVTPSLISGWPNFALSAAMMKSAIIATSQPPPSAIAGDRGDPRLAGRGDLLPAGEEVRRIHVGEALALHFLDVGAGGEGLFRSGQDQAALAVVGVIGGEGVDQLLQHRRC